MSDTIKIELDIKYKEHLELLKQLIPNSEWNDVKDDNEMVVVLIESFIGFIQEQAAMQKEGDAGHIHGPDCNH